MMRFAVLFACACIFSAAVLPDCASAATTAPPILVNSSHAASLVVRDFVLLHPELNSPLGLSTIDNTCAGWTTVAVCSTNEIFDANIIADAQSTGLENINVASQQFPVNHAPYTLVNNSFGWGSQSYDDVTYAQLQAAGMLMSWPVVVPQPIGTPPPLTSATVVVTSGPTTLSGAAWGVEFGMLNGYKGFDTSAPSWVTAGLTAVLGAMRVDHPSWSWFDIKAALRQAAANWSTGWNAASFGYGAIDYDKATAIAGTEALYLQPPALQAHAGTDQITFTVYPFRSSRRSHELVYLVPDGYVFPMKNELTSADVASLIGAGGQLLFTGNSTDVTPSGVLPLTPVPGVPYRLVALTTDGVGAYSRVEAWSIQTVTAIGAPLPQLVQTGYQQTVCSYCVVATYTQRQTAGDLNVVVVGWGDSTAQVTEIVDTSGNVYSLAVGPTVVPGSLTQSVYYAINVSDAPPGANSIIVKFNGPAAAPDIRIAEYSGIERSSPLDAAIAATGNSATSGTSRLATTDVNALLIGVNVAQALTQGPGPGYTQELLTPVYQDILEAQVVSSIASYTATAPLQSPAPWIMQLLAFKGASGASIGFVQSAYQQTQCNNCVVVNYARPQSAGDLSLVVAGWGDSTSQITSVTDTLGNTYRLAVGPTVVPGNLTQAVYYAVNSAQAPAGANSVVVTFNGAANLPDVRIVEYKGIDRNNPIDAAVAFTGNSATSSSGPLTTTSPNDLLVGINDVNVPTIYPGPGYTQELLTPIDQDIIEDKVVTSPGTYTATAPLQGAGPWIMQQLALKLASP